MLSHTATVKFMCVLLLAVALSGGCTPFSEAALQFTDSPHTLEEPFLSAWREAGSTRLGPPRSGPLWLDGRRVQLFDSVRLEAGSISGVAVQPQPPGWQSAMPGDLLALPAAPQQAELALAEEGAEAQPLQPLVVRLAVRGYSGPLELRLYDAQLRPAGQATAQLKDGAGELAILPRGLLGPQWAIALIDGRVAGARSKLFTLDAATSVATGVPDLDALYLAVRRFMEQDVTQYTLDGIPVRGYRSPDNPLLWLRDHVYQGRGFRYFERDVKSLLDAFRRAQRPDGSFPDVIDFPERKVSAFRKEVEADLEYLFVQGVYEAWQMTGDDAWLRENLAAMRRGLHYLTSDPLRWDAEYGLVRRPYTIDTWDFEFGPTTISPDGKPAPRHWLDDQTQWGIFHGDNTGLAYAMNLMARIEEHLGDAAAAADWRAQSTALMQRLNDLCWNGWFFVHFVQAEGPRRGEAPEVPGIDTYNQLSLSNAYALNRDVLEFVQSHNIIEAYFNRRDFGRAFAEWYSIDPPFPAGSYGMGGRPGDDPGEYVNGGIMPLVGGELARGALRAGSEDYGFDILRRYAALVRLTGTSYLWYYPDGRPGISGPDTIATDGWGSSAMLGALMEGAAGLEDRGSRFSSLWLSPRWAAAPEVHSVRVVARYAASDGYAAYTWERAERGLHLEATGTWEDARIRLLLPPEAPEDLAALRVMINDEAALPELRRVLGSRYLVLATAGGNVSITVSW